MGCLECPEKNSCPLLIILGLFVMICACVATHLITVHSYTNSYTNESFADTLVEECFHGNAQYKNEINNLWAAFRYLAPADRGECDDRYFSFDKGNTWWRLSGPSQQWVTAIGESESNLFASGITDITPATEDRVKYLLARNRMCEQLEKTGVEIDDASQFIDDVTSVLEYETKGEQIDVKTLSEEE